MTKIATVYGQALYSLAMDEGLDEEILQQLTVLKTCVAENPDYLQLLGAATLPKAQRCAILDESFGGKVHPYVLNFLKILMEKGYIKQFPDCVQAYVACYNKAHHILAVTAVTAVPMTQGQLKRLRDKLAVLTGQTIQLTNQVDETCMGGVRLSYDGKQMDDTVAHRLDAVSQLLHSTVL